MTAKRGRPRKIESPEDLERKVEEYILQQRELEKPVTLTGALLYIGINSRSTLMDYEKREGFSEPIKKLRTLVEHAYEERLHGNSPTGAIFALKNMGWSDRTEHELTGKDGAPIQTEDLGVKELARRVALLLTKAETSDG